MCSFETLALSFPSASCAAMDRSRSPHRTSSHGAGARPLVNFPVWGRPNTPDNLSRGNGLQTGHANPSQWTPGHQGFQPSQGLPLTQGSQHSIWPFTANRVQCSYSELGTHSRHPSDSSTSSTRNWTRRCTSSLPSYSTHMDFYSIPWNPRPPQHGPSTPPLQRPTQVSPPSGSTSRTPVTPGKTQLGRISNIPLGQHWKPDEEHYDIQKLNGLTLPRTIRASSWTQLKDIEGCDPLTVPLSKLLYQGSENFWLRKLATGREVYVATMGEEGQVVFVSEILSQLRGRGTRWPRLGKEGSHPTSC